MPVSKESAFLTSFSRKVYNPQVLEYFRDIDDDDLESIQVSRKATRRACLILPGESRLNAIQKQLNFWFLCQRVQDGPPVYGIPVQEYQQNVKFKPQIQLVFRQDLDAVPDGFRPMEGEISFRLINENSQTITKAKLEAIARDIKREFGAGDGYLWKKGKIKECYFDPVHGIDLRILAISKAEAVEIIQKVVSILGATYDADNLNNINPDRNSLNTPPTQIILGESEKKPRWRPTGQVRFRYARALIHGRVKSINLVDLTGRYYDALV